MRSVPFRAASSYVVSFKTFPSTLTRNLAIGRSPDQLTSKIFCPAPTIFVEILTVPLEFGRSHGVVEVFPSLSAIALILAAAKNPLSHSGSYRSTIGFELGVYPITIESSGVLAVTGPPQSPSSFTSLFPVSFSSSLTAVILLIPLSLKSPLSFAVFILKSPAGSLKGVFGKSFSAYVMNFFHAGAAQLMPSHVPLSGEPSTFPAHTTVVILGL